MLNSLTVVATTTFFFKFHSACIWHDAFSMQTNCIWSFIDLGSVIWKNNWEPHNSSGLPVCCRRRQHHTHMPRPKHRIAKRLRPPLTISCMSSCLSASSWGALALSPPRRFCCSGLKGNQPAWCLGKKHTHTLRLGLKLLSWKSIHAQTNISTAVLWWQHRLTGRRAAWHRPPWRSGWRRSRSKRCWAGRRHETLCTASPANRGSARHRLTPPRPARSSGCWGLPAGFLVKGWGPGWAPAGAARLRWAGRVDGMRRRERKEGRCWEVERRLPLLDWLEEVRKRRQNREFVYTIWPKVSQHYN